MKELLSSAAAVVRQIRVHVGCAAASIIVGGCAFAVVEHVPTTTGWWWALVTAATVGYGDVVPNNPAGRLVGSLVILTAIPSLAAAFAALTGHHVTRRLRPHHEAAAADAAATRQMTADLYKHLTDREHELAPSGEDT